MIGFELIILFPKSMSELAGNRTDDLKMFLSSGGAAVTILADVHNLKTINMIATEYKYRDMKLEHTDGLVAWPPSRRSNLATELVSLTRSYLNSGDDELSSNVLLNDTAWIRFISITQTDSTVATVLRFGSTTTQLSIHKEVISIYIRFFNHVIYSVPLTEITSSDSRFNDSISDFLDSFSVSSYLLISSDSAGEECPSNIHASCPAQYYCSDSCKFSDNCEDRVSYNNWCEPCDNCTETDSVDNLCLRCADTTGCAELVNGECASEQSATVDIVMAGVVDDWTPSKKNSLLDDIHASMTTSGSTILRSQLIISSIVASSVKVTIKVLVPKSSKLPDLNTVANSVVAAANQDSLKNKWQFQTVTSTVKNTLTDIQLTHQIAASQFSSSGLAEAISEYVFQSSEFSRTFIKSFIRVEAVRPSTDNSQVLSVIRIETPNGQNYTDWVANFVLTSFGNGGLNSVKQTYSIIKWLLQSEVPLGSQCSKGHSDCTLESFCSNVCNTSSCDSQLKEWCQPCAYCSTTTSVDGSCSVCETIKCDNYVQGECASATQGLFKLYMNGSVDSWDQSRQIALLDEIFSKTTSVKNNNLTLTRDQLIISQLVAGSVVATVAILVPLSKETTIDINSLVLFVTDVIKQDDAFISKWGIIQVEIFIQQTVTPTQSPTTTSESSSGMSTGVIVGIVLGVVGGLTCGAILWYFILWKKRDVDEEEEDEEGDKKTREPDHEDISPRKQYFPDDGESIDRGDLQDKYSKQKPLDPDNMDSHITNERPTPDYLLSQQFVFLLERYPTFNTYCTSKYDEKKLTAMQKKWSIANEAKFRGPLESWITRGMFDVVIPMHASERKNGSVDDNMEEGHSIDEEHEQQQNQEMERDTAYSEGSLADEVGEVAVIAKSDPIVLRFDMKMSEYESTYSNNIRAIIAEAAGCNENNIVIDSVTEGSVIINMRFVNLGPDTDFIAKQFAANAVSNKFLQRLKVTEASVTAIEQLQLKVYFKCTPRDHFIVVSKSPEEYDAVKCGYSLLKDLHIGMLMKKPVHGTLPVFSMYSSSLSDHMLVVGQNRQIDAQHRGYTTLRTLGYVYSSPGTDRIPVAQYACRRWYVNFITTITHFGTK